MATNLVISGGPLHDFESTTGAIVEILAEEDVQSTVFDDPHEALATLAELPQFWDMVTVNGLFWRMVGERYEDLRDQWSFALGDEEAETLHRYVVDGGGLLAIHTAAICFDADPRWVDCLGASWNWDRSSHPPLGPARIVATDAAREHPLTSGIVDFTTRDEIYGFLDQAPDLIPLLTSAHGDTDHPVLWARSVGTGRVVTDLLGHDAAAVTQPDHHEILRRAARWLTTSAASSDPIAAAEGSDATP